MAAAPDHARQAFWILHLGFIVAPILAGLDKFFEVLVDWDRYLAPVATDVLPVSAHSVMLAVGVVEIAAGVAGRPAPAHRRLRRRRLAVGHHRQPADPRRLLRHRPARLRALARRPCPGPAGRGLPRRRRRARVRRHLRQQPYSAGVADLSGSPAPSDGSTRRRPRTPFGRSSTPSGPTRPPRAWPTPPAGSRPPTPSCSPQCRSPPPPSPTTRATTSWWWPARSLPLALPAPPAPLPRRRPRRLPPGRANPRPVQAGPGGGAVRPPPPDPGRLTGQVAGWLQERLEPRGVGVVVVPSTCA